MKKLITSAGVVALGAMSLHAAFMPDGSDTTKPWSVSLALRGFYDSNFTYLPKGQAQHTFGLQAAPGVTLKLDGDQTTFTAGYQYQLKYYGNVKSGSDADHQHQFKVALDHRFNERNDVNVSDNFVIAQEPAILNPEGGLIVPIRSNGNNVRNTGRIDWKGDLTSTLGMEIFYNNNFYNYNHDPATSPSYSDLLDRIEHTVDAALRYTVVENAILLLGYRYGETDYLSNGFIDPAKTIASKTRNERSDTIYLGTDYSISSVLTAAARVGVQYTEYFHDSAQNNPSKWSPYADGSLTYTYLANNTATLGIRHGRNATDVGLIGLTPVLDQESTAVYGNINYSFTGDLMATAFGMYQNSSYSGSGIPSKSDNYYNLGVGLNYKLNAWLSSEAGYNLDRLLSDIGGRAYTRHYVYLGLRATY